MARTVKTLLRILASTAILSGAAQPDSNVARATEVLLYGAPSHIGVQAAQRPKASPPSVAMPPLPLSKSVKQQEVQCKGQTQGIAAWATASGPRDKDLPTQDDKPYLVFDVLVLNSSRTPVTLLANAVSLLFRDGTTRKPLQGRTSQLGATLYMFGPGVVEVNGEEAKPIKTPLLVKNLASWDIPPSESAAIQVEFGVDATRFLEATGSYGAVKVPVYGIGKEIVINVTLACTPPAQSGGAESVVRRQTKRR